MIRIAGCYITARVAPDRPHAWGIVVVISDRGGCDLEQGAEFGPHWRPLLLIVVAMPCAWIGGKLALD